MRVIWYIRAINVRVSHYIAGWSSLVAHMVHIMKSQVRVLFLLQNMFEGVRTFPLISASSEGGKRTEI